MVANMQSSSSGAGNGDPDEFVEIWAKNHEEEFSRLRKLVQNYPYVAMVSISTLGNRGALIRVGILPH